MKVRAVVFDLWNTIAKWPHAEWAEVRPRVAERLGLSPRSSTSAGTASSPTSARRGRSPTCSRCFDLSPEAAEDVLELRGAVTRQGLVPVPGAAETIAELRERGLKTGLITVCSEDVPRLWAETAFHGLFDAEVFSSSVGLRKPDPRIYRLALEQLDVPAEEAMFVGDGANDELGRRRARRDDRGDARAAARRSCPARCSRSGTACGSARYRSCSSWSSAASCSATR